MIECTAENNDQLKDKYINGYYELNSTNCPNKIDKYNDLQMC